MGNVTCITTLFVNKAAIENDHHGQLTWGAAQAGLAAGMGMAHRQSLLIDADDVVLIAAVWVNPAADNEEAVFENNRDATVAAVAMSRKPSSVTASDLAAMLAPTNPYFRV